MRIKQKTRTQEFMQNIWHHRALLFFILPGFILIVMFNYIPIFGVLLAFKNFNYAKGIFNSDWCGLGNFRFLFMASATTWRMIRNTIGYWALFTAVSTTCNIALAIALNECRRKHFARISQTIMILPTFISFIAITFIVRGLLNSNGMVNALIASLGGTRISFYSEPKYWPFILTFVNVWKSTGYGSILYLSALAGMDQEVFEAATLDGATKRQQIRYITLPMLSGMVSIMLLMGLGGIMSSNTGLFYQLTLNTGALYETTQTLDAYVLNAMVVGSGTLGPTAAVTFFQSAVGCFMVVTVNLIVRKVSPDHSLF